MKKVAILFGYMDFISYVSTVIEREMMMNENKIPMKNVKELLKSWKHDLAHADEVMGTDYETLNEEQFGLLEESIIELETAIEKDLNQ